MDTSKIAIAMSRGRIAFGLAALAAPSASARAMGGTAGATGLAPMYARMFGARDVALGLGTIVAIDRGAPVRGWLEGAAMADAADCLSSVLHRKRLSANAFKATVGIAGASAVIGALLARTLDPPPEPPPPGHVEAVATGHHPVNDG